MPIDSIISDRFALISAIRSFEELETSPDAARRMAAFDADEGQYSAPDISVTDHEIPGPHGSIGVRLYRPRRTHPEIETGLLWMHGGGFRAGNLDVPEGHTVAAELAERSNSIVVSVDYRLADGTVRFPVPLDDVVAAWWWFVDQAPALGLDPLRIAIGGASAGASLAAAATLRVRAASRTLPAAVLLAYPVVHFPVPALEEAVLLEMAEMPQFLRFTPASIASMYHNYVGRITDLPHEAVPGHADLDGFPPTAVLISEFDDLRPSGELFATQLEASGVHVSTHLATGMTHGHLNRHPGKWIPEVGLSLDFFAEALGVL